MPRIRSIKPEFFMSQSNAQLSLRAMLTFAGLWCYVDDHGRGLDDPRLIKAAIWPQRDEITIADVADDITELNTAEKVLRYEKNGTKLLAIRAWRDHQRVSHPAKSKYPAPPRVSRKSPETLRLPLASLAPEVEQGSGSGSGKGTGKRNRDVDLSGVANEVDEVTTVPPGDGPEKPSTTPQPRNVETLVADLAAKKAMGQ